MSLRIQSPDGTETRIVGGFRSIPVGWTIVEGLRATPEEILARHGDGQWTPPGGRRIRDGRRRFG